jgi:hypothetical protein
VLQKPRTPGVDRHIRRENPRQRAGMRCCTWGGMSTHQKLLSLPFVSALLDPTVIPHVYDTCDQWCTYCPVTSRCLAYRCRPEGASPHGRQPVYENIAAGLHESLIVGRELRREGGEETTEIDQILALPRGQALPPLTGSDPIEQMGRRFAFSAARYLSSRPESPFSYPPRPGGPTPAEILAWFSILVPVKVYRALVSRQAASRGQQHCELDALRSARVALLGIERSRTAIAALRGEGMDEGLEGLDAQLRRLASELTGRFPDALSLLRPGLDMPAAIEATVN